MARREILRFDLPAELRVSKTAELMRLADACLACSGSVSLELMYYRKPTVIVYQLSRFFMWIQCWALRIKFITLVNLMATDSIQKVGWRTYDPDAPGAEEVPMPEYLTAEDKSSQMAKHVIGWLNDQRAMAKKVQQLDQLAREYAWPGASQRAAEFILSTLAERGRITRHAA
jgi:lipid-A-disaccharide synthase